MLTSGITNDELELALTAWLAQRLGLKLEQLQLNALAGDAGFRRYWRVSGVHTPFALLAVYGPPSKEKNREFVEVANYLSGAGIAAPKIVHYDFDLGFMLLEDLGHQSLFDLVSYSNVESFYSQALSDLSHLSQAPRPSFIAAYDKTSLVAEMDLFQQWFVPQLLVYELDDSERGMLNELSDFLSNSAVEQPQVCVLRDFHSRNIIVREDQSLAYIDFQDALWGPCTYDLVSLLRDCYVRWSAQQLDDWCQQYLQLLRAEAGIEVSLAQFKQWFDLMGLQRHIKVLGVFARLYLRDGKTSYLDDLPLVIRYTLEVAERYPQTQSFSLWFKSVLLPRIERQSWYQRYQTAGDNGGHLER